MKIFFPDIHITLTKNLSKSLQQLGHQIILPSKDYQITEMPPQNWAWNTSHTKESIEKFDLASNSIFVDKEELFDIKPDVIFVSAFENQFEVLNVIWPEAKKWGAKLAFYSGNDYWNTAYPWDIIQNYMPADQLAAKLCKQHKKHFFHYRPWIDYDMFSFDGVSDGKKIGTYICDYKNNFPEDHQCYTQTAQAHDAEYILCENETKERTSEIMNETISTLHIKRLEGYGFAIIESMAKGRPVFFWEPLTQGKSYLQWLDLGVTGFVFRDLGDYISQQNFLISETEFRHEVQNKCAKRIRDLINNEEQNLKLNNFLNNLL
jgi:hypothetical protein